MEQLGLSLIALLCTSSVLAFPVDSSTQSALVLPVDLPAPSSLAFPVDSLTKNHQVKKIVDHVSPTVKIILVNSTCVRLSAHEPQFEGHPDLRFEVECKSKAKKEVSRVLSAKENIYEVSPGQNCRARSFLCPGINESCQNTSSFTSSWTPIIIYINPILENHLIMNLIIMNLIFTMTNIPLVLAISLVIFSILFGLPLIIYKIHQNLPQNNTYSPLPAENNPITEDSYLSQNVTRQNVTDEASNTGMEESNYYNIGEIYYVTNDEDKNSNYDDQDTIFVEDISSSSDNNENTRDTIADKSKDGKIDGHNIYDSIVDEERFGNLDYDNKYDSIINENSDPEFNEDDMKRNLLSESQDILTSKAVSYRDIEDSCIVTKSTKKANKQKVSSSMSAPTSERNSSRCQHLVEPMFCGPSRHKSARGTYTSKTTQCSQFTWYQPVDSKRAEELVKQLNVNGAFVIWDSDEEYADFPYCLTVFCNSLVYNVPIRIRTDGMFALGTCKNNETRFVSVVDLVKHHREEPIKLTKRLHRKTLATTILTASP